jgi:hypothetical protein
LPTQEKDALGRVFVLFDPASLAVSLGLDDAQATEHKVLADSDGIDAVVLRRQ